MIKGHVSGPEGPLDLIPVVREGALVLGIQIGLHVWTHVGPGQTNHILVPTLVLDTVVHHAVHPVEEVVGWEVFPIEGLGLLVFGLLVLVSEKRGNVVVLLLTCKLPLLHRKGAGTMLLGNCNRLDLSFTPSLSALPAHQHSPIPAVLSIFRIFSSIQCSLHLPIGKPLYYQSVCCLTPTPLYLLHRYVSWLSHSMVSSSRHSYPE